MKKFLKISIGSLSLGLLLVWWKFGILFWTSFIPYSAGDGEIKESSEAISVTQNLRQSPYDCGAYNAWTVIDALGSEIPLKNIINLNREKFIPRTGVVPEVVKRALEQSPVYATIRTMRWNSDEEKIENLKRALSAGNPLILLVKRHGYMHFITVTGFDGDNFNLYDPLLAAGANGVTIDRNGESSGNDALLSAELIKIWNEISVWGFYKNIVISVAEITI